LDGSFIRRLHVIQGMVILDENEGPRTSLLSLAGPIMVMALSIAAVATLYLVIGHIGPTYSANVMSQQQARTQKQFQ